MDTDCNMSDSSASPDHDNDHDQGTYDYYPIDHDRDTYDAGHNQYHEDFSAGGGGSNDQVYWNWNRQPPSYGHWGKGGGSAGNRYRPPRSGYAGFSGRNAPSNGSYRTNGRDHGLGGRSSSGGSRFTRGHQHQQDQDTAPHFTFGGPSQDGSRGPGGFKTPNNTIPINQFDNRRALSNHSNGNRVSTRPSKRRGGRGGSVPGGSMPPQKSPKRGADGVVECGEVGESNEGVLPRANEEAMLERFYARWKGDEVTENEVKLWAKKGDAGVELLHCFLDDLLTKNAENLYKICSGGRGPHHLGQVISQAILNVSGKDSSVNMNLNDAMTLAREVSENIPQHKQAVMMMDKKLNFLYRVLNRNIEAVDAEMTAAVDEKVRAIC